MKQIKNCWVGVELKYYRMSGNSTRQIDVAIQHLFNGHIVEVKDHHEDGTNRKSNQYLFDRILDRLGLEHNLSGMIKNNEIKINKNKLRIELIL